MDYLFFLSLCRLRTAWPTWQSWICSLPVPFSKSSGDHVAPKTQRFPGNQWNQCNYTFGSKCSATNHVSLLYTFWQKNISLLLTHLLVCDCSSFSNDLLPTQHFLVAVCHFISSPHSKVHTVSPSQSCGLFYLQAAACWGPFNKPRPASLALQHGCRCPGCSCGCCSFCSPDGWFQNKRE